MVTATAITAIAPAALLACRPWVSSKLTDCELSSGDRRARGKRPSSARAPVALRGKPSMPAAHSDNSDNLRTRIHAVFELDPRALAIQSPARHWSWQDLA